MFVLKKERVVKWPVDVAVAKDGGTVEVQRFTAHFRLLPDAQVRELVAADADGKALLRKVMVHLTDVSVEGGDALTIEQTRELLLESTAVRAAASTAYFQCLHGAPAKNVVPPPPGGPAAAVNEAPAAASPPT